MVHHPRNSAESERIVVTERHLSFYRRLTNHLATGAALASAVLVIAPLLAIFGYLLYRGIGSINLAFLTHTPRPVG